MYCTVHRAPELSDVQGKPEKSEISGSTNNTSASAPIPYSGDDKLSDLPLEIVLIILELLPLDSVFSFFCTSRRNLDLSIRAVKSILLPDKPLTFGSFVNNVKMIIGAAIWTARFSQTIRSWDRLLPGTQSNASANTRVCDISLVAAPSNFPLMNISAV